MFLSHLPSRIPSHIKFHSSLILYILIYRCINSRNNRHPTSRNPKRSRHNHCRTSFHISSHYLSLFHPHIKEKIGNVPNSSSTRFSRLTSSHCDFSYLKSTSPIHTSFPNTTAMNSSTPGRCAVAWCAVSSEECAGGGGEGG